MKINMKNGAKVIQVDEKRRAHYEQAGYKVLPSAKPAPPTPKPQNAPPKADDK